MVKKNSIEEKVVALILDKSGEVGEHEWVFNTPIPNEYRDQVFESVRRTITNKYGIGNLVSLSWAHEAVGQFKQDVGSGQDLDDPAEQVAEPVAMVVAEDDSLDKLQRFLDETRRLMEQAVPPEEPEPQPQPEPEPKLSFIQRVKGKFARKPKSEKAPPESKKDVRADTTSGDLEAFFD